MPTVELHPSGFTPPDSRISGWRGQGWTGVHSVCWPLARCGGRPVAPFGRILAVGWLSVCVTAFANGCHVVFHLCASAPHGERGVSSSRGGGWPPRGAGGPALAVGPWSSGSRRGPIGVRVPTQGPHRLACFRFDELSLPDALRPRTTSGVSGTWWEFAGTVGFPGFPATRVPSPLLVGHHLLWWLAPFAFHDR